MNEFSDRFKKLIEEYLPDTIFNTLGSKVDIQYSIGSDGQGKPRFTIEVVSKEKVQALEED